MKGIRKTPTSWQVYARRDGEFLSKRFPLDTTLDLERERDKLIGRKVLDIAAPDGPTFARDAKRYLSLVTGMPSYDDRAYEIGQWMIAFEDRTRAELRSADIRAVLEDWRVSGRADGTGGLAASSLNKRRTALMHLYTVLDGKAAANPVKDVPAYDESASEQVRSHPPRLIYRLIARVGSAKWHARRPEHRGRRRSPSKTRARLRLMLWTGWPQKQIMELTPKAIDWKRSMVWVTPRRKGKGHHGKWVPVLPGAITALKAFAVAKAWGKFSTSGMHKSFRLAVAEENAWRSRHRKPQITGVYPYTLRHTHATAIAKVITDERALQDLMLHGSASQTRRYSRAADELRMRQAVDQVAAAMDRILSV